MNQGGETLDVLFVTQRIRGDFVNIGPQGSEEVTQDDLKVILKPGEREETVSGMLFEEFNTWIYA